MMERLTLLEGDRLLAQLALDRGVVRAEDLARAISASREAGDLGRLLVERSMLGDSELSALLALVAERVPGYSPPAPRPPSRPVAPVIPQGDTIADDSTQGDATITNDVPPAPIRPPSEPTLLVGLQTPPKPPATPRPGRPLQGTFGKFEILGELGKGAMGVVYRAREALLSRIVALKVLHGSHAASASAVARFQKEAKTAAQLCHPGIVRIHEVGIVGDAHYMSMDLIEGKPLSQLLAEKTLPLDAALAILKRVAEAVDHAHRRGVIHRDLKPSNVLIDAQGNPFVTDFGLAREVASSTRLTLSGTTLGTPPYMPPEQALGETDRVDQRSDVYSLGAILYEILTGEPPFTGGTPFDIIVRVIGETPVPPRRHNAETPAPVETICLKAIEKDPSHRYPTAAAFALDLDRYLRREPIAAKPVSLITRSARVVMRNRLLAGVAVAGLLVVLGVGGWVWSYRSGLAAKADVEERERKRKEAEAARAKSEAARREAARHEAERLLQQAAATRGQDALDLATKAVETDPAFPAAVLARSRIFETLGKDDLAMADLSRAIDLDAACIPAYLRRAWILDSQGKKEEAAKDYARVVELEPDSDVGYIARAKSSIVGKNYGEAEVDCTKAIQINPRNAMAYATRAFSYWLSDQQKRALDDYRTAIKMDPAAVNEYLTQTLMSLGGRRPSTALMEMTRGIQADPDSPTAKLIMKAFVAALEEKWPVVLIAMNQIIKENPDAYWGRLARGAGYMNAGMYPLAVADFNWCIQKDPTMSEAWNLRAYVKYQQGQYAAALPDYAKAIECEPTDETAWNMRGWCLAKTGKKEEAEKCFAHALELAPRSAQVRIEHGEYYAQCGELEKALEEYSKALEMSPKNARAHIRRAGVLQELKRQEEAQKEFEQAIAIDPEDPVAWNDYGCAMFLFGRYEEAARDFEEARKRSPTSVVYWSNVASALAQEGKHFQAVGMFDETLARDKSHADVFMWRAGMWTHEGRYALAARDALKLAELTRNADRRKEAESLMRKSQAFEKPARLPRVPRVD